MRCKNKIIFRFFLTIILCHYFFSTAVRGPWNDIAPPRRSRPPGLKPALDVVQDTIWNAVALTAEAWAGEREALPTDLHLSDWDSHVRLVEAVGDVPAEWAEFDAFLNESVEETQSKDELLKYLNQT